MSNVFAWQQQHQVEHGSCLPVELEQPSDCLMETIAVRSNKLIWFNQHKERLQASAHAYFGIDLHLTPPDDELAATWSRHNGRLRWLAWRDGSIAWTFQTERFTIIPMRLYLLEVEKPLGPFKTGDRTYHNQLLLQAQQAGADEALLTINGELLEGTFTNLFVHDRVGWHTPATDGRILPGIARKMLLEQLHESGYAVEEQVMKCDTLQKCDRILLCNALRGVIPVQELLLPNGQHIVFPKMNFRY